MRRKELGSQWKRLYFDGDERHYAHLPLSWRKVTILKRPEPAENNVDDATKNEEAHSELIQVLDDKSLSLVIREVTEDTKKALEILREHFTGKLKPRVISLYTELTSLQKAANESFTDYVIHAETAITALKMTKKL